MAWHSGDFVKLRQIKFEVVTKIIDSLCSSILESHDTTILSLHRRVFLQRKKRDLLLCKKTIGIITLDSQFLDILQERKAL